MNDPAGLNENHIRHVASTYRYLDNLLSKAEQIMASAGSPSPFREYADDTSPLQRKVTRDYMARLREKMSRYLEELHCPRPVPVSGALWAVQNTISFANIALADLESKRMGGYGQLSGEAARQLDGIVADLRATLGRLDDYLAQGNGHDLQLRLQRLEKASNSALLLRELERVVTAHGLVEFRSAIGMLLDRMEDRTFEIGVFGRVSSGKSSLLNYFLEGNYLPVGITPVTTVPTRISFSTHPEVVIEFAESRPRAVEVSALAQFATEQQNPGNAKRVSRIRVHLSAARLREGITFVDTPGLGSLATDGAEATAAYLPRCDLGIVLVDAASTLTKEDLQLVQAIYAAGATPMVLVSKADLLKSADRERALDYLRKHFLAEANVEPSVHLVSVVGAEAQLCDHWFDSELRPMLDAHRELLETSLKRKIGGLRDSVVATLKRRIDSENAMSAGTDSARLAEIRQSLREGLQMIEATRRQADDLARQVCELDESLVDAAANEIAGLWLQRETAATTPVEALTGVVNRILGEATAKLRRQIEQVRDDLTETLRSVARTFPTLQFALQELPQLKGLPLPDPSVVSHRLNLRRPAIWAFFGRTALRRHLGKHLHAQVDSALRDFLSLYSMRLVRWAKETLNAIGDTFSASADIFRAQSEQGTDLAATDSSSASVRRDISLLENWEKRKPAPATVLA